MELIYIGAFPPKWGGVTVKNKDVYNELITTGLSIRKIDIGKIKREKSVSECISLVSALMGRDNRLIIGISAASRRSFVKLLHIVNRKTMNRSIMLVMGGAAAKEIAGDRDDRKRMSEFKRIYVETQGMRHLLTESGMKNVSIYPNCRKRRMQCPGTKKECEKLQCVFFSLIQKEKGVDEILETAGKMTNVDLTFYGHIDNEYLDEFKSGVERLSNCTYKGVFRGTDELKYRELSKYDVMLLPTKWDREGIPGILVEAKIAGLSCIVSNVSYNAEIVQNNVNGIVLTRNDSSCLTEAIRSLNEDRGKLEKQKEESFKSAENYYIENYIDSIIHDIRE